MRLVLISLLFVVTTGCFAQLDNSSLLFNTSVDTSREQQLFIKIQNLNFLKNNEYSGVMADGYTLFGYQFNPQLGYQFTRNLSIEGGIFLAKDFGNSSFTQILPTFSLRYYKKDFKMVFGNIDGSLNHQLIEPIYNFERVLTNRLESGMQFVLTKKRFDFDIWIDWLHMIYKTSNQKERLLAGISGNALKFENDQWDFKLPMQGIIIHRGGQLDSLKEGSSSDYSGAAGLILKYKTKSKVIKDLYLDTRYVIRSNNYFDGPVSISSWGDGILANIGLNAIFRTNVLFSYWHGDSYHSEFGGDLYSSKSRTVAYPYYSEQFRDLLIMRITKKIGLAKGIDLTLRVEPYYDFGFSFLEYSHGFYISIDEKFWLKSKVVAKTTEP